MFRHRQDDPGFSVQQKTFCTCSFEVCLPPNKDPTPFFFDLPGFTTCRAMWEIIENAKSKLCQLGRKNENKENKKGEISGRRPKSDDLKRTANCFSPVKLHEIHGKLSRQQGWRSTPAVFRPPRIFVGLEWVPK